MGTTSFLAEQTQFHETSVHVGKKPKGLALTLSVNWLIKACTMAPLGVLFFKHVFAGLVPTEDAQAGRAGPRRPCGCSCSPLVPYP